MKASLFYVLFVALPCAWAWSCEERVIGADRAVGSDFFQGGVVEFPTRGDSVISSKASECVELGDLVFITAELNCTRAVTDPSYLSFGFTEIANTFTVDKSDVGKYNTIISRTVATGPKSTLGFVEFSQDAIPGYCTIKKQSFGVSAPTLIPMRYKQQDSPLNKMIPAESVDTTGLYTYNMDMTESNVLSKVLPRIMERNVSFIEGYHARLSDGSVLTFDHCDQLKQMKDGDTIIARFDLAKFPGTQNLPKMFYSMDAQTWVEHEALYVGNVARVLPNKSCCYVRFTFNEETPDEEYRFWTLLRYSLTAHLPKAPAHTIHGIQLTFAQTSYDGVKVELSKDSFQVTPVFDFSLDGKFNIPLTLTAEQPASLSVAFKTENVEVEDPPAYVSVGGTSQWAFNLKNFDLYTMQEGKDAIVEVKLSYDKVYAQFIIRISGKGAGEPLPPRPTSTSSQSTQSTSQHDADGSMKVSANIIILLVVSSLLLILTHY